MPEQFIEQESREERWSLKQFRLIETSGKAVAGWDLETGTIRLSIGDETMVHRVVTLLAVLLPSFAPAQSPAPLPREIVDAWVKEKAEVGWLRSRGDGRVDFLHDKHGAPGDVPGFYVGPSLMKKRILAKLP